MSWRSIPAVTRRRRERGTGSIFHRKGRGWVAQVAYRGPDGRRHFLTRLLRDERSAKLALPALLARVGGTDLADPHRTLDAFLAEWLERVEGAVSPATKRSYEGHVRLHIAPLLGGFPVDRLRAADVDRLVIDCRRAGLSPATVQRILTTLSMALEQAVREGSLPRNVARLAHRPRVDRVSAVRPLSEADRDQILELVAGDPFEALYSLLLGSGIRLGEALALNWRDVDLDRGLARIRDGKTARARRLAAIAPFAVSALRAHRASSSVVGAGEPLFRGLRSGARLRSDAAYGHWQRLRRGLPPMRLHDLRHGHATLLLAQGTPMRLIADQLGHADPGLTSRVYAHVIDEQRVAAVRGLGERRRSG